jgi:hypothetical protein
MGELKLLSRNQMLDVGTGEKLNAPPPPPRVQGISNVMEGKAPVEKVVLG